MSRQTCCNFKGTTTGNLFWSFFCAFHTSDHTFLPAVAALVPTLCLSLSFIPLSQVVKLVLHFGLISLMLSVRFLRSCLFYLMFLEVRP